MKHRILGLCLLALITFATASAAHADTFDFSFSGRSFWGSGTLTATHEGSSGIYDVTNVAGTVTNWAGASNITSLLGKNQFNDNDNKLIFPGILFGTKSLDSDGLSFGLADGVYINLNDTWGIENAVGEASKRYAFAEFDLVDISKNSTVPEPSSLALFGTGILGIAGALRLKLRLS